MFKNFNNDSSVRFKNNKCFRAIQLWLYEKVRFLLELTTVWVEIINENGPRGVVIMAESGCITCRN